MMLLQQSQLQHPTHQLLSTHGPKFCHCGICVDMPTKVESVCCRMGMDDGVCVMNDPKSGMANICLDEQVVRTAVSLARDLYAEDIEKNYNHDQMRHAAYKQYIFATAGNTGSGNRIVIPSCIVS